MSKCRPKNTDFISKLEIALSDALRYCYHGHIDICYDAHPTFSKKDYVLQMTVSREWNGEDTKWLKEIMKDNGATGIIGGKRKAIARDYIDLAFDEKIKK
jgi:hypothetical protein